jgi:hypothetical protein
MGGAAVVSVAAAVTAGASTSSRSSGSGSGSGGPVPPPPPDSVAETSRRRGRWGTGASVHVPGHLEDFLIAGHGAIKIDIKHGALNAHCNCLGQPGCPKDHRTVTTKECRLNRAANKAPLGLLICWLRSGLSFDSRKEHYEFKGTFDFESRSAAREWAKSQPQLLPILEFEAKALGCTVATVREPLCIS